MIGPGSLGEVVAGLRARGVFSAAVARVEDMWTGDALAEVGTAVEEGLLSRGLETPFDLGSLTKPFTATLLLRLITADTDRWFSRHRTLAASGHPLDIPVSAALNGLWASGGRELITFRQLLSHTSGLPPGAEALRRIAGDRVRWDDELHHHLYTNIWEALWQVPLETAPGSFAYSDLGYMALGEAIAMMTGLPLDVAMRHHLLEPLGMDGVVYGPCFAAPPTRRSPDYRGYPHDLKALAAGRPAGHAGLFAPASAVARLMSLYIRPGFIARGLVQIARTPHPADGRPFWGLGWRLAERTSTPGIAFSSYAYGHFGTPGASAITDPARRTLTVFLSNFTLMETPRVSRIEMYAAVHRAVADALPERRPPSTRPLTGGRHLNDNGSLFL